MPIHSQEDLLALWQSQAASPAQWTPEQLRARAEQFESQTRRRYVRDQASFALVAAAAAFGVVAMHGLLVRLGSATLLFWALYGMYGLHRFASALPILPRASAGACVAVHRRQLERQRDIVSSWPLGMGLAIPGFTLTCLGYSLGPRHLPWEPSLGLLGIFAFLYLAMLIHGKRLAGRWQREIDALVALQDP